MIILIFLIKGNLSRKQRACEVDHIPYKPEAAKSIIKLHSEDVEF